MTAEQTELRLVHHKVMFIEDIKPGTGTHRDLFQIVEIKQSETRQGQRKFLDMVLGDRTGRVPAKKWESILTDDLKIGVIVRVEYEPELYPPRDGRLQFKVHSMDVIPPEATDAADYLPASKKDRELMMATLEWKIDTVKNPELRAALQAIVAKHRTQISEAPAAQSKHQAYIGGLVEHILNLLRLAEAVCRLYPDLDRDVMIAGCVVHDIGKIFELEYQDAIGYSLEGSIIGHISLGMATWSESSANVDPVLRAHISHVLLSHHGRKDWGSPVVPMTREAAIFHYLDQIDARYANFSNLIAAGVDERGLTAWDKSNETRIWNGK